MTWRNHDSGAKWFVADDGRIKFERGIYHASEGLKRYLEFDADGFVRTEGKPKTAKILLHQHGEKIEETAERFNIAPEVIAGIICCESGRYKGRFERDPVSERHESGFITWDETPHRGSGGLGQQLLSTARAVVRHYDLEGRFLDPFGDRREVEIGDCMVSHWGIFFCGGYLRMLADKHDTNDPIILTSAYNTGGVYYSSKNVFHLRAYGGEDRFIKHAAYANDWLAVNQ